jgi:hypothetical protein
MFQEVHVLKLSGLVCALVEGRRALQEQTINTMQRRLRILRDDEIQALYGRLRCTDDARLEYFVLSPTEKATLAYPYRSALALDTPALCRCRPCDTRHSLVAVFPARNRHIPYVVLRYRQRRPAVPRAALLATQGGRS